MTAASKPVDSLRPKRYEFGRFRVDPARRLLLDGDRNPIDISAKSFDFLVYLIQHAGRVVERAELMDALWPRAIVEENTLSQVVLRLRNAIGEGSIVTVKGRGYQFAEEVRIVEAAGESDDAEAGDVASAGRREPKTRRLRHALTAGVLLAVGLVVTIAYRNLASPADSPLLAVLPFASLSPDPEQEYFADGLSVVLTDSLSRIGGLDVIHPRSAYYFKGTSADLDQIRRVLNAGYLLDGSVLRDGDRLRIAIQLIEAGTGSTLWSETYQRSIGDVFAIQDDIVEAVGHALEVTLRVGDGRLPGMTHDVNAFDAYLRAMALPEAQLGGEDTLRAIEYLELAVTLDESFSTAWVFLGRANAAYAALASSPHREEFARDAEAAYDQALALTPGSAYVLLNEAQRDADRGALRDAGALYEQLPRLLPEYEKDGYFYFETGLFLARVGRIEAATEILEATKRIDPLSGIVALFLGDLYAARGKLGEALAEHDRGLGLEADALELLRAAALRVALATGDRAEIERRIGAIPDGPDFLLGTRLGGFLDDPAAGLAEIRSIEVTELARDPVVLGALAAWSAYYGDPALALALLERLPASGGNGVLWINMWQPIMSDVRRLPGFTALARELGLVDYWREFGWSDLCRPVGQADFECE